MKTEHEYMAVYLKDGSVQGQSASHWSTPKQAMEHARPKEGETVKVVRRSIGLWKDLNEQERKQLKGDK